MNILVTGGCGFIGKTMVDSLSNDHNIIVIDINVKIEDMMVGVEYNEIDLSCPTEHELKRIRNILSKVDIVFHFASSVGVEYVDKNPSLSLQNSINISNVMFPLFDQYQNKVIYSSSSEVYGDTSSAKETDILKIGCPDKMRWGYACSKLMSEFMIKSYTFPYVIIRFFNVTGEGQQSNSGMVLSKFIDDSVNGKDITVFGDGNQNRTFCDIRDALEMLKIVAFDDVHNGEIYNIGNPSNNSTINDLAKVVVGEVDLGTKIKHIKYDDIFSNEFGEIYERKPNTDKIQKYYKCEYSLVDTVRSMI